MSTTIALRRAIMADAQALFDVHRDAVQTQCAAAYSEAQLRAWFEGRRPDMYRPAIEAGHVWLAECRERVLGFVGFVAGEVTLLFVRHDAAGAGLGRRLFAFGVAQAQAGFDGPLTVVATLNSARDLPTRWYGYEGVTAVVISTSNPEIFRQLSETSARITALDQWVRMGGRLSQAMPVA